jgi:F-type H+-transporting ATPase subunit b
MTRLSLRPIVTVPSVAIGCVALLCPLVAFAQENPEHEGMPQLNFNNVLTTSQVVWMVIVFAGFYVLLSRWALPQVASVLETRAASIAADLTAAREAKAASDEAAREVTQATRNANAEAQARIAEAVAQANSEAAARLEVSNKRLDEQLAMAEAQIAATSRAAMGALRQVAAETASSVVDRLTGRPSPPDLIDSAVASALAARGVQ